MYLLPLVRLAGFARKHPCWSKRHLSNSWPFVCLFCQLTVRQAWVEARRTARTAAGAEGRRSSVAARPLLRRRRLRRQAAGWPAAGAGGPVAGAALAPETETGGKGLLSEPHWAVRQAGFRVRAVFPMSSSLWHPTQMRLYWQGVFLCDSFYSFTADLA